MNITNLILNAGITDNAVTHCCVKNVVNDLWLWNLGGVRSVKMTKTYRRQDIKLTKGVFPENDSDLRGFDIKTTRGGNVRDGAYWRGCGDQSCPWCSGNRQNKKVKEYIRGQEIIREELIG